jgi:membrane-bound ClpP family serine protease
MLFRKGGPLDSVILWLIAIVVIIVAGFLWFAVQRVVTAHHRQVTTGREELVGKKAVVKQALEPQGMVMFKGELWAAVSESGPAKAGEEVTIIRVEDLIVYVTRK